MASWEWEDPRPSPDAALLRQAAEVRRIKAELDAADLKFAAARDAVEAAGKERYRLIDQLQAARAKLSRVAEGVAEADPKPADPFAMPGM